MKNATPSDRLRQIMKEQHLKQVDILNLARPLCEKHQVKLNKSDLSQYVSGKVVPGQDKLFILSAILGVNEAWLMGYDVPKEIDANIPPSDDIGLETTVLNAETERLSQDFLVRYRAVQQKMNSIAEKLVYLPREQMESVLHSYNSIADVYFEAFKKQQEELHRELMETSDRETEEG